jgi:DNA-binding transcriptional LysR family regulator
MELRQLRYFLSVADTEHLTQSAQALFVTQSTLSHGLRQLEDELGVQLFERVGRGLKLSQSGQAFRGYAARALQELESGRMELARLAGVQTGTLALGVIPTFMDSLVPAAAAAFSARYPGVRLSVLDLRADLIEEQLVAGQLDCGIAFHPTARGDIEAEHLFSEQLQLLVAASHPLARRRTLPLRGSRHSGRPASRCAGWRACRCACCRAAGPPGGCWTSASPRPACSRWCGWRWSRSAPWSTPVRAASCAPSFRSGPRRRPPACTRWH